MRCMSCGANIPPEWIAAIKSNSCPGCAGEIMTSEAKQLLDELTDAMKKMPNNPQGVAGWLLSNYQFRKIGDCKPVEKFHDKSNNNATLHDGQLKIAENPANKFLERTDAYRRIQETQRKINPKSKLAAMARSIADGNVDAAMYGGEDDQEEIEGEYYDEEAMPAQEQSQKLSRQLLTGEQFIDPRAKPLTPEELQAISGSVSSSGEDDAEVEELKARQELDFQRRKRLRSQNAIVGGGPAAFTRS